MHAYLLRHVVNAIHGAIPNNVVNADVIAHKGLYVVVHVNYANKAIALLTKEIQERRILAERIISVVGEVGGSAIVAKKQNNAIAHELFQLCPTIYISLFAEHNKNVFEFFIGQNYKSLIEIS